MLLANNLASAHLIFRLCSLDFPSICVESFIFFFFLSFLAFWISFVPFFYSHPYLNIISVHLFLQVA